MCRHPLLDNINRDLAAAGAQQVCQKIRGAVDGDFTANQHRMRQNTVERAFQLTHITDNAMRHKFQNLVGNFNLRLLGF